VVFGRASMENLVKPLSPPRDTPDTPDAEFDAYSRSYDEAVNKALAFSRLKVDLFTRVKADYLRAIIDRLRPPSSTAEVLDVGCGVGNMHALLFGHVASLAGVDVSEACIETARSRNPWVAYAAYNGIHLPYDDRRFDIAFAACVFHHVPIVDRLALAREIRRVLRPGGIFAIFEHNPLNPLTMHVVNNCEFDKHAVLLDQSVSEALMATAGFQNIATRFILTIPAIGPMLRSLDRLFSTFPIGAQYYTIGRA
jgi:SAM-dependent methyltransferase